MTIEIRDKRNIDLVQLRDLKNGDHFMFLNCLYVMSQHEYQSGYCLCTNIKDGTSTTISKSDPVQQVHLVIEIHLV
ncbi:hypothetical protein Fifi067_00084 [Erwinia phage Fifi067]|nr:hypothetical protein Fifi067_00084 [Erwinia phage Fifi067]